MLDFDLGLHTDAIAVKVNGNGVNTHESDTDEPKAELAVMPLSRAERGSAPVGKVRAVHSSIHLWSESGCPTREPWTPHPHLIIMYTRF